MMPDKFEKLICAQIVLVQYSKDRCYKCYDVYFWFLQSCKKIPCLDIWKKELCMYKYVSINNYTGTIFFNKNELRDHFLFLFLNV